jgi:hypothetical protein
MTFIHGAFDHKINTGDNSDDGKDDGSVDQVLYTMSSFLFFFITCILFMMACTRYVMILSMTRMPVDSMSSMVAISRW